MKLTSYLLAVASIMIPAVSGATVIVDATGATPGSVTTINAALAGSDTDIVVKNTGLYSEALLITRNVTIRGENAASRPIIAQTALASQPGIGGSGDGIWVGGDGLSSMDLTIALKNLILIPALSGGITDDAITGSANPGGMLNLVVENVLIAPNNGANQPLATSAWDTVNLSAAGAVRVPDDGIYLVDDEFAGFDGNVQATLQDVVVIGVGGGSSTGDAIVTYVGDGASSVTLRNVGVSYSGRYGLQLGKATCDYYLQGSQTTPSLVTRKNTGQGVAFFRGNNVYADHVISVENNNIGFRCDSDAVSRLELTNSLVAKNTGDGFWTNFGSLSGPHSWIIKDSTFYDNGGSGNIKIEASVTADSTYTFTDCIIAGAGDSGVDNLGGGALILNNCALVTVGPDALANAIAPTSVGSTTQNSSVSGDPQFISTAVAPVIATSFDIGNPAYGTVSSVAGPLNGWGDGPNSQVRDWSVY